MQFLQSGKTKTGKKTLKMQKGNPSTSITGVIRKIFKHEEYTEKKNNFASLCLDNTCNEKKLINKSYNIQIFFYMLAY